MERWGDCDFCCMKLQGVLLPLLDKMLINNNLLSFTQLTLELTYPYFMAQWRKRL